MYERQARYQEQDDPIEGETDCDAKEREATADIHRISRPCEHADGRKRQCRLRRSNVCADVLENAIGADYHSQANNERNNADHNPSKKWNMGEQTQWHNEVEDNPRY